MTVKDLIEFLSKFPSETKVLINAELGWYDLQSKDVVYQRVYNIWHSDYNNNGIPYIDYSSEPRDFSHKREQRSSYYPKLPDYECRTLGDEMVVILG